MKPYTFSVSEVFPDGRVMVFTYVHLHDTLTAVMDVYTDMTLTDGKRVLNLHWNTNQTVPTVQL